MPRETITVIDVLRDLRIEPTPSLTWSVGARMRAYYESKFGRLPEHCFAVYLQRSCGQKSSK